MGNLAKNWLTYGWIDFEYKKYIVLSYLKEVQEHFHDKKLYPVLSELVDHVQSLESLKLQKTTVNDKFPKTLEGIDLKRKKLLRRSQFADHQILQQLDEIIDFALALFRDHAEIGRELYEEIKESITIEPIGVVPLYHEEGFLFLTEGNLRTIRIYKYVISPIKALNNAIEEVRTQFLDSRQRSIANTFENLKMELIKMNDRQPNPATYSVHSELLIPIEETYLPLAKSLLLSEVAA